MNDVVGWACRKFFVIPNSKSQNRYFLGNSEKKQIYLAKKYFFKQKIRFSGVSASHSEKLQIKSIQNIPSSS
jgi:hypothetical protein